MKRLFLSAIAMFAFASVAFAQTEEKSNFVPYTVDEKTHQALAGWAAEMPTKWGLPLINQLNELEKAAQASKSKPEEKK